MLEEQLQLNFGEGSLLLEERINLLDGFHKVIIYNNIYNIIIYINNIYNI